LSVTKNVKQNKMQLTSEEKLMASFIKYEQLFKKYRYHLLILLLIIAAYLSYSVIHSNLKQSSLKKANEAFLILQQDPNNQEALEKLAKNNEKLYQLFIINQKLNASQLDGLKNYFASSEIADIVSYHNHLQNNTLSEYDGLYSDLAKLIRGYQLLRSGEINQARTILKSIPKDSNLYANASMLLHYKKVNEE